MSNSSSSKTSDDRDEYPKVTQADLDRATFRVGLKPAPGKQRVTLINDTLRRAMERESLEETLRRIIREELHRGTP
ncbi:MAG: hypothetical protein M3Z21_07760 [Pseudomonadota bacterium]|nr:hypothetical protein [Pseudomonadota bacterium]